MNGPDLNLTAANVAATAYLKEIQTPSTDTPLVEPQAPPVPDSAVDVAATPDPAPASTVPPAPAALAAEDFVDVEIEPGKTIKVHKDGKDGYLRLADYTRKTQEAARIRKEAETQYEQLAREAAEFREFLNNPAAVAAFVAEQQKLTPTPPAPDDLVSAADLNTRIAAERAAMERTYQDNLQRTVADLENRRQVESMRADFDKTVSDVLAKHSVLLEYHDVEEIAQLLKLDAGKAKPQSADDARKAIIVAAEARAKKLTGHSEKLKQQQAIDKADQIRKGIEPPGGVAPLPVPTNFKLGDKSLVEAATRYLQTQRRK